MTQKLTYLIFFFFCSSAIYSQMKMDIASAEVHYASKSKMYTSERVLIFSDSGRITKTYQVNIQDSSSVVRTSPDFKDSPISKFFIISRPDSLFSVNLDKNTFTGFAQNRVLAEAMNADYFANRVKTGNETILGLNCEVFKYQNVTVWTWKDVPLKRIVGADEIIEVATYFNPDYKIKDDEFALPSTLLKK